MKKELKETILLLRIPFSVYLMPIFIFSLSQTPVINVTQAIISFLILHLFVYPASNGYNSYEDKDTESIGGLEKPPLPSKLLYQVVLIFDISALLLSIIFINWMFTCLVATYVLMSRLYSYKGVRLKKYPIISFLTVFVFQGFWTFWMVYEAVDASNIEFFNTDLPWAALASSLMIGGAYPLSQIYQHKQDQESGDFTISILLGIRGTFIFSIVLFTAAAIFLYYYFEILYHGSILIFISCLSPLLLWFNYWMFVTWKDANNANFKNLMMMNNISAICMNLCYIIYALQNHTSIF
ncbi:UbiA family prenyltransferase [Flammeovirga sp. MY04]|uniref:UbiA family prenyltransferase n=1 Tax=Flammeovirga sp. MY04 TaxID=1191459 RepID=UPI0008063A8E|nr:UbiA family prenyltransferase [Flammeovirga sp. MY04]ANQ52317.1 UbiA family prenyltransferase [Flammeovirga sp. MY04]